MMHSLLSAITHLAARLIVTVLFWVALFPIAVALWTPVILTSACFDRIPYPAAVRDRYGAFFRWWMDSIPTVSVNWS